MSGVKGGQKKCPEPCPSPPQEWQETCIKEPVCPEPKCPPTQACQEKPMCPKPKCPPPQEQCEPTPQCHQEQDNKGVKK